MPLSQWSDTFQKFLHTLAFSDVADVLSVIGFGLTIWLLVATSRLKNSFRNRVRSADLYKALIADDAKLVVALSSWPTDKKDALQILRTLRSQLESLKSRSAKEHVPPIKKLIKRLNEETAWYWAWYKKARPLKDHTFDEIFDIHIELLGVLETAKQHDIDANWS
jgi:hypothetical protein